MIEFNKTWDDFIKNKTFGLEPKPLISRNDTIFTMGSCFANEIRLALAKQNMAITPALTGAFKRYVSQASYEIPSWGSYDERVHLQFYTTHSMLQEFEKAFGLWMHDDNDVWVAPLKAEGADRLIYQDPYKRRLFAHNLEDLLVMRRMMENSISEGLITSDVVILTLGLTEAWKRTNGYFVCEPPKLRSREIMNDVTFLASSFEENLENMRRLCSLYFERFPKKTMVITVSPVALWRSFVGRQDVVVSNTESKAILRAVAGQICREFDNAHYFPSYEFCLIDSNAFEADGRHVRPAKVDQIVSAFLSRFISETLDQRDLIELKNGPHSSRLNPIVGGPNESIALIDRVSHAGPLYEGHWDQVEFKIDALINSGERNLHRLLNRIDNEASELNTRTLGKTRYRVAGTLTPAANFTELSLESDLFIQQKKWLIRRFIPPGITDIVELGSGIGNNLFSLWLEGLSPEIRYHALEFTVAGRRCAEKLASLEPSMRFESAAFDYYEPDLSELQKGSKLFVFTCYSVEQITYLPDKFFDRLLGLSNLHSVLHIEPVGWQYPLSNETDIIEIEVNRRMIETVAKKGYNQTLVSQLHALERSGRIVIERELTNFLAHRPDLPGTAILYRPT